MQQKKSSQHPLETYRLEAEKMEEQSLHPKASFSKDHSRSDGTGK